MKFEKILQSELSELVETVERIKKLTNLCGKTLSKIIKENGHKNDNFIETALQFNRISYESTDAIILILKNGNISESIVLLRWYLEYAHLFFYLSKNSDEYEKWLRGKEIRPQTIGKFFESQGIPTWEDTYSDWSDVTHANSRFVEKCSSVSRMNPVIDDMLILSLGQILIRLMIMSMKILYVIGPTLKPILDVSEYNKIFIEYNELDDIVIELNESQKKWEDELLK